MFGVGKLIGGALKAVGLEKLAPIASLAVNAFTGNFAGVAMDVAGLASRLTGGKLGFLSNLTKLAPIANAFMGGGANIGDIFKSGGLKNLVSKFTTLKNNFKNVADSLKGAQQGFNTIKNGGNFLSGASKIFKAFETVDEFIKNKEQFNLRLSSQHIQYSLGNFNQEQ